METQYYERLLDSQRRALSLPKPLDEGDDPREYIKNPMVAEFMGFRKDATFNESELEQALIDNLQQFIMEMGRGFAFVDRQKHISTDVGDFYVDLVFYNINLHSYVLIDLLCCAQHNNSNIRNWLNTLRQSSQNGRVILRSSC